jgi:hypothetical protein
MAEEGKALEVGDKLVEEILDGEGKVLYRATHEVVAAPARAAKRTPGAAGPSSASAEFKAVRTEEEYFDDAFRRLQEETTPVMKAQPSTTAAKKDKDKGGGGDPVKTALEVAKFAWEFIKDNKPVVNVDRASTSVLAKGTEGLDYSNAKLGSSGVYQWRAWNWPFEKSTAWDIRVELAGSYGAKPPAGVAPGTYLPSVYFNVPTCEVNWPHSASASAQVMNPSNIGSSDNVNPTCDVLANLNASNVLENRTKTFKFRAIGRTGFSKV